jgi:hypothetical protein
LYQYDGVLGLLELIRGSTELGGLDILMYTGFSWDVVISRYNLVLPLINSIIIERFDITRLSPELPFRGSYNQRLIDVGYYIEIGKVRDDR